MDSLPVKVALDALRLAAVEVLDRSRSAQLENGLLDRRRCGHPHCRGHMAPWLLRDTAILAPSLGATDILSSR
jgi:hypothetical protein